MDPHLEAELRRGLLEATHDSNFQQNNAPTVGLNDRQVLSSWEKWATHGRFPYKLALHVALVLLTFTQMQLYDAQSAAYMRASYRNWAFFFLPPSADSGVINPRFQRELYTIQHTLTALLSLRDSYFSIGDVSVANYEYLRSTSGKIYPISLAVDQRLPNGDLVTRDYLIYQNNNTVGPFDSTMSLWQKKHLFRSLQALRFSFRLRDHQFGQFYQECFEWQVNVRYEVIESAQILVQLEDCEVMRCVNAHSYSFVTSAKQSFVWMHVIVAVISSLYMALCLKSLRRYLYVSMTRTSKPLKEEAVNTKHREYNVLRDDPMRKENICHSQFYAEQNIILQCWSPFVEKLRLINNFQFIVLTSLILLLSSTTWRLLFLEAHTPISFWHRWLHATALLLLWSSLVGYLQHNKHIFSIVLTLQWGTPRVLQFLLGVFPIFFGYALFGTIYFGNKVEEFGSLSSSMITLFSLMNGDVIMDTFDALELHLFFASGKVYMYSFISLFIYVVLNIFIAIVEEAFFATQASRCRLNDMLSDRHVQDDELSDRPSV